jgi:glutathione S-transferase
MPRTLYISQRSPFARKVQIVLREKALPFELVTIDLTQRTPEFTALSPLNKVPLLVDDDGTLVFDSTVIAEYLEDRYPASPILGTGFAERLRQREFDELGDTVAEQTVAIFFDADKGAVTEKGSKLLDRTLDVLCTRIREHAVPNAFGLGQAAVISGLGYMEYRLGKQRSAARPELAKFLAPFMERASVKSSPAPRD